MTDSATRPFKHSQPFQHTFAAPTLVASSTTLVCRTPQPPIQSSQTASSKLPTLVLSASPTPAPISQANCRDTAPAQSGDQGYLSPLLTFTQTGTLIWRLYVTVLGEPISYENVLDAAFGSEADPANS